MKRESFVFHLPERLIAQSLLPCPKKTRLLILFRNHHKILHRYFEDLIFYLEPKDLLILNDTKVIPTRLWGMLESGGQVEVTLINFVPSTKCGVNRIKKNFWEALVRPQHDLKRNLEIYFGKGRLKARLIKETTYGGWILRLGNKRNLWDTLNILGEVNIPFYINRSVKLKEYQNIYAKKPGSTQCPTAGLHFRNEFLNKLKKKGVDIDFITLHIGGSVLPITVRDYRDFRMYKEYFEISQRVKKKIERAKKMKRRIVAVGTTVVRALETMGNKGSLTKGWTDLTIRPPYNFKVVDAFLTNFHLPGSSHLLLTSAFGGIKQVLEAYKEAIKRRYRFLDFGEAMLII